MRHTLHRLPRLCLLLVAGAACDGTATSNQVAATTRVVTGPIELVGDGTSACSHQPVDSGGSADRWCAFAGPHERGQPAELWVVNVNRARQGQAACDGTSPHCLRLTAALWTGEPLFSSHPGVHGFYGDTLIFYADSTAADVDDPFQGTVHAWRPGMAGARVISGPNGFYCFGHERTAAAVCLSNQNTSTGALEFDLMAGAVAEGTSAGPVNALPTLERIRPYERDGSRSWSVAFSPDGQYFAFSTRVPADPAMPNAPIVQRLRVVPSAMLGVAPPGEILRDLQSWSFSPDGKKVLFLRGGVNTPEGPVGGSLTIADFPTGQNVVTLAATVDRYEALGKPGGPLLGVGLFQETVDLTSTFRIMPDVTRPAELITVATGIESADISPDARYSHFQRGTLIDGFTSFLARNDGTGECRLNQNPGQAAVAPRFAANHVFWSEEGKPVPGANPLASTIEGWYANPATCGEAFRFSQALGYLQPTAGGLLWGEPDASYSSMKVRYAPFNGSQLETAKTEVISDDASFTSGLIDGRYYFYTVKPGAKTAPGLYVHGPLR